jgi:molybdate transport system substrate-binding protein
MASLAVKAAYLELAPAFERSRGEKVETEWVGMADIRKRLGAGEVVDAVIGSAALLEELAAKGRLDAASRVDIARAEIGAAVRAGARKPDIGSVEAFKNALRAAKSVVYSSGPSGVYLAQLFHRLGMAEELKSKAVQAPPGTLVGERVARGEFELCFQQVPELAQVAGLDYVGPLPAEIQLTTAFAGAVHVGASRPREAAALLDFLASRDAQPVLRRHGLEPA